MKHSDKYYMKQALKEAKKAFNHDEVPIGCVLVDEDGKIISRGFNKKEELEDVTAHAEIIAIRKASKKLKNWRLNNTTLYVTLEPCLMCAGAILSSRISKIVIGAKEPETGAFGSKYNVLEKANQKIEISFGILEDESKGVLIEFFKSKRKK